MTNQMALYILLLRPSNLLLSLTQHSSALECFGALPELSLLIESQTNNRTLRRFKSEQSPQPVQSGVEGRAVIERSRGYVWLGFQD